MQQFQKRIWRATCGPAWLRRPPRTTQRGRTIPTAHPPAPTNRAQETYREFCDDGVWSCAMSSELAAYREPPGRKKKKKARILPLRPLLKLISDILSDYCAYLQKGDFEDDDGVPSSIASYIVALLHRRY